MPETLVLKTDGLEAILSRPALGKKAWMELIEIRRSFIKPYLNTFTLKELGSVNCLQRESYTHDIAIDGPKIISEKDRFSLKTQGIFHTQPYSAKKRVPNTGGVVYVEGWPTRRPCDGAIIIWGLTRANQWIIVNVNYVGEDGYKGRGYERAISVEIKEADLDTLILATEEKPRKIWEALGKSIKEWTEAREYLYKQALSLAKVVEMEEIVAGLSLSYKE